ncbi:hypothetical protein, partial [Streptosporangium canum]|uniref:hypothetical protein n=1 Tax=Streptosporangium canum TaxID=324952 RepID=UPI0034491A7D
MSSGGRITPPISADPPIRCSAVHRPTAPPVRREVRLDVSPTFGSQALLKRSPRMNPGDSSRPDRAALRTVATLLLGGSPSGPVHTGFHAPARDP